MSSIWTINDLEIGLRVGLSLLVGGIIGLERAHGQHHAGFRTHILVCLGSTLITLISTYGFSQFVNEQSVRMDPARLTAQIISGIGFLGAGTILRTGNKISGLTTAASLWVVAALGIGIGAGFYFGTLLTFLAALISLFVLQRVEKRILPKNRTATYTVTLGKNGDPGPLLNFLREEDIRIKSLKMDTLEGDAVRLDIILFNHSPEMKQRVAQLAIQRQLGIKHLEFRN